MIEIHGLRKMPLIRQGDRIADQIVKAAREEGLGIFDRDIIVVAQKIVSKAEGRILKLAAITPSSMAIEIARTSGKDPRHVEAILRETARVIRRTDVHLIVETQHGFVCANAGVDRSNVDDPDSVVMLPVDPDRSAREIRKRISELTGCDVGVIISDTFGRAWRVGQVNVAVGVAGLKPIMDYRGSKDMFGRTLTVTQMAVADELASAAELVMRKAEGVPVAVIRGYLAEGVGSAKDLIRPREEDLFR